MQLNNRLSRYMELVERSPELFLNQCEYEIILDVEHLLQFESVHNKKIGILYESDYSMVLVDLVRDGRGAIFPYERVVQKGSQSAVVIIPIYQGDFVLLGQSRHATRNQQLCFPRGFGTEGLSLMENAYQELQEELGAKGTSSEVLGYMTPDSGMISTRVAVVLVELEDYTCRDSHEGIASVECYTESELKSMLREGVIEDGFTLAALGMYFSRV